MRKIPTIFVRDMTKQPALVTPAWAAGCEWVRDGEGIATRKWDGTSVLIREGKMFKRRELRAGEAAPADFESLGTDENTGKTVGWVPVGDGPYDKWHREAACDAPDGTYELVGPKVNGNRDKFAEHCLVKHGGEAVWLPSVEFDSLKEWLAAHNIEGVV
jgi:hypothetical protein